MGSIVSLVKGKVKSDKRWGEDDDEDDKDEPVQDSFMQILQAQQKGESTMVERTPGPNSSHPQQNLIGVKFYTCQSHAHDYQTPCEIFFLQEADSPGTRRKQMVPLASWRPPTTSQKASSARSCDQKGKKRFGMT